MSAFYLNANDTNREHVEAELVSFIRKLSKGKQWRIEVKRYVKERTSAQNRALFGVAYPPLSEETGYTLDELHNAFCRRYFGTVDSDLCGVLLVKPLRTTTKDENGKRDVVGTEVFSAFYEMVKQVGAEAGVFIPDPEPARFRNEK